jgi:hypothetical protein
VVIVVDLAGQFSDTSGNIFGGKQGFGNAGQGFIHNYSPFEMQDKGSRTSERKALPAALTNCGTLPLPLQLINITICPTKWQMEIPDGSLIFSSGI